jgi:exopolyphosphatase / guanosine-5'-triphosphate,3'-diphosphate pyrophosphatase
MIAAALDLGSNTLRLLVAEIDGRDYRDLARGLATPRLGRGLQAGTGLHPEAKALARAETARFVLEARKLGAQRIALAATAACRLAIDGEAFVAELKDEFALDLAMVIGGEREASLSRAGVLSRLQGSADGALMADVGGGSSEVSELSGQAPFELSLPLGAVALSEAHLHSDPPSPGELLDLLERVGRDLRPLAGRTVSRLVATAGTAATMGAMLLGMEVYEPGRVNNLLVSREQLEHELARLAALPLAQRRRVPGLEPERADIILAGMAILGGLLLVLELNEMTVMDAGLLEGILLELAAA